MNVYKTISDTDIAHMYPNTTHLKEETNMYTPIEIRENYEAHKLLYVAVKTAPFRVIDIDENTNRIEVTQAVRGSSIYKFYYEGGETLRVCTDPSMRETNLVLAEILTTLEMTSANLFQDITYMNFKPRLREV